MTKEEAINIVRNICQTDAEKEALATLIPELRESEDERIRKFLIDLLSCGIWKEEWPFTPPECVEYLEKQKDASKAIEAVERIDKYIDAHTANAHDMDDSNPDKKYYQDWDDALGKIAGILQDVYSDEKQKVQKPAEWNPTNEDVILFNKAITTNTTLTPAERAKLDIIRMKFKHCNGNIANSTEWSEEDETIIEGACGALEVHGHTKLAKLLKSLRPQPHWRPSEEQMIALRQAISGCSYDIEPLVEIQEHLKKLREE